MVALRVRRWGGAGRKVGEPAGVYGRIVVRVEFAMSMLVPAGTPPRNPSRPAAPIAAGRRYGLVAISASLNSIRGAPLGMRTSAERLLPAHVAAVGDHVAPELVDL